MITPARTGSGGRFSSSPGKDRGPAYKLRTNGLLRGQSGSSLYLGHVAACRYPLATEFDVQMSPEMLETL
jgi:hypothetical protein